MKSTRIPVLASLTFLLGLHAATARAQPPPAPPPPRLEATAQAALLATTGNASTQSLGVGGDVTFRPELWTYRAAANFAETRNNDELAARSLASLFRASRTLSVKLAAFGQYDFLRDRFAGVERRHLVQGGLSYLAIDGAPHRLRFDGGIGYEHETRLAAEDSKSAVGVGGAAYRWRISPTSELVEEARGTLPFANSDQWKLDQSASLTAAITTVLSLKLSNIIRFVNDPVPGFERTDTITSVALVMKILRPAP